MKLKINQRIDDFRPRDPNQQGGGLPTNTRSAITEVMVRDRDTIAMGGLLRDKDSVTFSKVPVLGDIPVLGWLFKSKERTLTKVNLLFFMTPRILAPYNKTASNNTLDVMAKRESEMKGIFEGDDKDPSEKSMKNLKAKVEKQVDAPLYDEDDAAHYRNLNDAPVTPDSEEDSEMDDFSASNGVSQDIPDYKSIAKSVE